MFRGSIMEPILGQIQLFAFGFAPEGWLPCNGQVLQIMQYQAVFSLLGTTYGGDGRTTFALPNLNGVNKASLRTDGYLYYCIAMVGYYPIRP